MATFLLLIVLVPIIAAVLVIINYILAPHRPIYTKKGTYECGLLSRTSQSRQPFSVLFYVVATLFIAFDLDLLASLSKGAVSEAMRDRAVRRRALYERFLLTHPEVQLDRDEVVEVEGSAIKIQNRKDVSICARHGLPA